MRTTIARLACALLLAGCGGGPEASAALSAAAIDPAVAPVLPSTAASLDALSIGDRVSLARAIAEGDSRYAPAIDEAGVVVAQPGGLSAVVTSTGARLRVSGHAVRVALGSIGRGAASITAGEASPTRGARIVELARGGGVTEWWRALPSGLEHGVTIAEKPAGDGLLRVRIAIDSDLSAESSDTVVMLRDAMGTLVARYTDLWVVDADGRSLAARFTEAGRDVAIEVDDAHARYPIVVDPTLIITTERTITGSIASSNFGYNVAITSDGLRILVGAPAAAASAGVATVYLRNGTVWNVEQQLNAPDAAANDLFGSVVGLAGDGSRAVIGAPRHAVSGLVNAGTAYVFARNGTVWSMEAELQASVPAAQDGLGTGAAIAVDGSRVVAGASGAIVAGHAAAGRFVTFVRSGTSWSQESSVVEPTPVTGDHFGTSIAIDDTASRALVGAPNTCSSSGPPYGCGTGYVFTRSGTVWSLNASITPASTTPEYGILVAMSGDGSAAAITAYDSTPMTYTTFLFGWTGAAFGSAGGSFTGGPAAIDGDGSIIVIDDSMGNQARAFLRSTVTSWSADTLLVQGWGFNSFPLGAAISRDGTRFVEGNSGANQVIISTVTYPQGHACTIDGQCSTGFCADGVCCDTTCGGSSPTDCMACDGAHTATNGTCGALSNATAVTCRGSAGLCDVAETCQPGNQNCPADGFMSGSTVCRAMAGVCDIAESCTGSSATCPTDAFVGTGIVCRGTTGMCDQDERCSGSGPACPPDVALAAGTVCRIAAGACDIAETCSGSSDACPPDAVASSGTVCRMGSGPCDATETCNGSSVMCPSDVALPNTTVCHVATTPCDVTTHCDGVTDGCPRQYQSAGVACRAPTGACDQGQVCNGTDEICAPSPLRPAGYVCRAANGPCDASETCSGASDACPIDVALPATTMCHAASGACDTNAFCDGFSDACPTRVMPSGSVCRASAGPCDLPEVCDGFSTNCAADTFMASTTQCRAASGGGCDQAAFCNGASAMCPPNAFLPSGTNCGGAGSGSCSGPGTCSGSSATCPGAMPLMAGTVCAMADPANPCDLGGSCNGTSMLCQMHYAASTTPCGPAFTGGACDMHHFCPGTSSICSVTYVSGVMCRAASGACDVAEACSGSSPNCPPDSVEGAGTVCRASTASCDPAESCDGTGTMCPPDVSSCMTMPDMGAFDGGAIGNDASSIDAGARDGGPGPDVGSRDGSTMGTDAIVVGVDMGATPPPATGGCGCRVDSRGRASGALALVLFAMLAGVRRRTRRSRS